MKKYGFTLAEVLITLGILGVIAAVTIPGLMLDSRRAQIGPKLAAAVSAFEQANIGILNSENVDTLSDAGMTTTTLATYLPELARHMKGTFSGTVFTSKPGVRYELEIDTSDPANVTDPAHMQRIADRVVIDINGSSGPGIMGTDRFVFSWWNDGSLRPKGATNWNGNANSNLNGTEHWMTKCQNSPTAVTDYTFCAGSVFENDLKVRYIFGAN